MMVAASFLFFFSYRYYYCDYYFTIAGIIVRDFRGIASIQEVECSGGTLAPEVKLLSLKLLGGSENTILAYVSPASNECRTFVDFSSCVIDSVDSRNSRARTLVSDLAEKEVRTYTCVAQTWKLLGDTQTHTWSVLLEGPRKFLFLVLSLKHIIELF